MKRISDGVTATDAIIDICAGVAELGLVHDEVGRINQRDEFQA